jgi:branched-chain amino acid transport system substrate-binding protein
VLTTAYFKDPTDPTWKDDAAYKKWAEFMGKYFADGDKSSSFTVYGYAVAQTLVQVLKQCGNDLTRENVMKQAANLKDFAPDTLLPGVKINTTATDFAPINQLQMMRFKGEKWDLFGDVISGELSN